MKLLALIFIIAMELTSLPKPIQDKINDLYGTEFKADFKQVADSLTPSERVAIIQYLSADVERAGSAPTASEDVLVNLGDDAAIAREAQTFPRQSTGGGSYLISSIQPKVIVALAPKMFSDEPFEQIRSGDVVSEPVSFLAAGANRAILAKSPYFSTSVNAWAKSWYLFGANASNVQFRQMMCNWWKANSQYFATGNYAAVQPGPPLPYSASPAPTASRLPIPTPFPVPTAVSTPLPVSSTLPLPATPSSSHGLEVALSVLAILVAISLFLLRRKS